jgi:rubrerythrin
MAGKSLKGTKSHENLKEAFAGESEANRRYLYFARVADIEGFPDMAGLFKGTADAETGHAFGHMDFLRGVGGKLSAVHFVRFAFPPDAIRAFMDSPVHLVVDHPAERARVELSPETKAQRLEDLRG